MERIKLEITTANSINTNWIGIVLVLLAAIVSNVGIQLQKHSHYENDTSSETKKQLYIKRKAWLIGLLFIILGAIGDLEALGFATQSLVASVGGGFTVLVNVFFSVFWHKETFSKKDIYGTAYIITGVVLISWNAPADKSYNLNTIVERFQSPMVTTYFLFLSIIVVVLILSIAEKENQLSRKKLREKFDPTNKYNYSIYGGSDQYQLSLIPYYYAMISGVIGSVSMLLAKCVSELLTTSIRLQSNPLLASSVHFYILFGLMVTIMLQTHWLNKALMKGDVASVFPVFQVFWIAFGVLGGMIFYDDFVEFNSFQSGSFLIAFCAILAGVYLLSQHQKEDLQNEDASRISSSSVSSQFPYVLEDAKVSLLDGSNDETNGENEFTEIPIAVETLSEKSYRPPVMMHSYYSK